MKKQNWKLRIAVATFALFATLISHAYDFMSNGICYDVLSETDRTVAVTMNGETSTYEGDIVIPSTVENDGITYSVTAIGDRAFFRCSGITSVSLPNSVTTIGYMSFLACYNLTSVNLSSVTTIGTMGFISCFNLASVDLSSAITIGDEAFNCCKALTSIDLPYVTTIGKRVFNNCINLTSINLPSATTIGVEAFCYCDNLTSINPINIPSVTTIGEGAFSWCENLTSVNLPNSVTTIDELAFVGSKKLTSVNLPESVTTIGYKAFIYCNLTSFYCMSITAPEADTQTFVQSGDVSNVYQDCILYIPKGSRDSYEATTPWSNFVNIQELEPSGAEVIDAEVQNVKVSVEGGDICIDGSESACLVEVYSGNGACVYRGCETRIAGLAPGIYLVRIAGKTFKVAING